MANYIGNLQEQIFRTQILELLADLTEKIETSEPFPGPEPQSDIALSNIHDEIEECLNRWYWIGDIKNRVQ